MALPNEEFTSVFIYHLLQRLGCRVWVSLAISFAVLGCSDGAGPLARGRSVFVTSQETHELILVDGSMGRVARRIPLKDAAMLASFSADSSLIYLAEGFTSAGNLVAVDTKSLQVRWSEAQSTPTNPRPDRWNGVLVDAYGAIAPSIDETTLFVVPAFQGDTQGIAQLDASTRNLVEFGGAPLSVEARGLVLIPLGPGAPSSVLLAAGRRDEYAVPPVDWLFVINPVTLSVQDSLPIVNISSGASRYLLCPVLAPDGRSLYLLVLAATASLSKYDVVSREVVANVPLQGTSCPALSPDGARLYQARKSPGRDSPAALLIYDNALGFLDSIDLPDIDGQPPVVQDVATSPDGSQVYVTAGTGSGGVVEVPLQPGYLIAIDPVAKRVLWMTALGVWAPKQVFVR